jgi:hypothetical protein
VLHSAIVESVDTKVEVQYHDGGARYGEDYVWSVFEGGQRGSGQARHRGRLERTGGGTEIVHPHVNGTKPGKVI